MKLYIIGNGFDLAHDLPTKFSDFIKSNKEYETKYAIFYDGDWNQIENTIGNKILEKRREIEELTNQINVDEITDDIISSYGFDEYGQIDYHGYEHEELKMLILDLGMLAKLIFDLEQDFKQYLKDNISYDFNKKYLLDENVKFINFNYTETIEKVYEIKDVQHIHGSLHDKIKIGYNSNISKFDNTLGSLDYLEFKDIIVKSKHDLPDRQSRYDDVPDSEGNPTGEVVPNHVRFEFHNKVKGDIIDKKDETQKELHANDKSKFGVRMGVMDNIKNIEFDEIIILGHSLGEMDYDFFDEIFSTETKIQCNYFDEKDLENKQEIAKAKKWDIEFISNLFIKQ